MRTVTFSDAKVAEALADGFVSAWTNRIGGFHNCDPNTEQWIFTSTAEAYTTRNICTFFLTPDLQVVHYVGGYVAPDLFLEEIAFAAKIRDECFDGGFAPRDGSDERFVELHAARRAKIARAIKDAAAFKTLTDAMRPIQYGRQKHRHDERCTATLQTFYGYLQQIHDDFASDTRGSDEAHATSIVSKHKTVAWAESDSTAWRAVRINVSRKRAEIREKKRAQGAVEEAVFAWLPALSELREDYRYGNPFAEEWTQKVVVRK